MAPRKPAAKPVRQPTAQAAASRRSVPSRRLPTRTLTGRSEQDDAGAKAARLLQDATYTDKRIAFDRLDGMAKTREAAHKREQGEALLQPPQEQLLLRGGGEAFLSAGVPMTGLTPEQLSLEITLLNTLKYPNMIALGASQLRMEAVAKLGVLQPALDAAETAQASNSLEKMLCHQFAVLHHHGMGLMGRAVGANEMRDADPATVTRLTNAAVRVFECSQATLLTLLKFRTGGKQTVVVQHVNVSDGGQAVIAGSVRKGGGSGTKGGGD